MSEEREHISVGEILDTLLDESTTRDLDFKFFLEALSAKVTRRQAIILRLMLMGVRSQVEIAKMLGYSFVTISVDIKKLREIVKKLLSDEGIECPKSIIEIVGES